MGGSYMFFRSAAANLREKEDSLNPAFGGFVAGAILGTRCEFSKRDCVHLRKLMWVTVRTMPSVMGYGAGLALLLGTFDYTGGNLRGYFTDPDVDETTRKELLRKTRRRPIEETVESLGEGRGMETPP